MLSTVRPSTIIFVFVLIAVAVVSYAAGSATTAPEARATSPAPQVNQTTPGAYVIGLDMTVTSSAVGRVPATR